MRIIRKREKGFAEALRNIENRGRLETTGVEEGVAAILAAVRERGDAALVEYTEKFDGRVWPKEQLRVGPGEIRRAYKKVPADVLRLFEESAARIRAFHERQGDSSWFTTEGEGNLMGQIVRPLGRVGLYVPGGKASYPSSVLMNAIPAQVAGVSSIAVCTPAPGGQLNPHVLVAADMLGLGEIYRIGGAQAVGAMAYGTSSLPRVHKIVGPGNIYVATAKKLVYGEVDIDMVAGPSEILVIADAAAEPAWIAADLLSQAEHDEMAHCLMITDSTALAEKVRLEVQRQLDALPRSQIAREAIARRGVIIVVNSLAEAFDLSNRIAPEHLEVATDDPMAALALIDNAGSIFLGHYTPEPLGDYMAGPNHVLPTGGTARFSSTLGVESFLKRSNILYFSEGGLKKWSSKVAKFARLEGLEAHARSALARGRNR